MINVFGVHSPMSQSRTNTPEIQRGSLFESLKLLTSPGVTAPDILNYVRRNWASVGSPLQASSITSPGVTVPGSSITSDDSRRTNGKGSSLFKEEQGSTRVNPQPHYLRAVKEGKRCTGKTQRHGWTQRQWGDYVRPWVRANKNNFTSIYNKTDRNTPLVNDLRRWTDRTSTVKKRKLETSSPFSLNMWW